MEISRVGQMIDNAVKGLGETGKIVRDIFQKLEEFKQETDKNIQKDILVKAEKMLEELKSKMKMVTPQLQDSIDKLQEAIDEAQRVLRGGI